MKLSRSKKMGGVIIIVTCLAYIFFHETRPARNTFGPEHDFVTVVAGSRCIADRCDPYDSPTLEKEFQRMGGYTPSRHFKPEWPVYPPSTLLLLFPLSLLPWPIISAVWMLLCAAFVIAAFLAVYLRCKGYRDLLSFFPFVLLLADGSMGWAIELGQPVLIAAASLSLALVVLEAGSMPLVGALLLAISLLLKPQAAYLCVAYLLLKKSTRLPAAAASLLIMAFAAAGTLVLSLRLSSMAYLGHLANNLKLAVRPGGDADFSQLNTESASYLNLQAFFARLIHDPHLCTNLTYLTCAGLGCLLIFVCWRSQTLDSRPFTILTALIMLELLVSYHRLYDHIILLAALPGFYEVKERSKISYLLLLAGLVVYHFSQFHGMTIHGRGPFSSGPPVQLLIFSVCLHSLWQNRRLAQLPAAEQNTAASNAGQAVPMPAAAR